MTSPFDTIRDLPDFCRWLEQLETSNGESNRSFLHDRVFDRFYTEFDLNNKIVELERGIINPEARIKLLTVVSQAFEWSLDQILANWKTTELASGTSESSIAEAIERIELFLEIEEDDDEDEDEDGSVLHLNELKLNSLPPIFTNPKFKALTELHLDNNQLKVFPDSIRHLTSLNTLILSYNQLESLPEWIKNFTSLNELYLDNNELRALPDSIGDLRCLTNLILNTNQLTSLPDSIGNLPSLNELDIGDNQLTTFPEPIKRLNQLQLLCIDGHPWIKDPTSRDLLLKQLSVQHLLALASCSLEILNLKSQTCDSLQNLVLPCLNFAYVNETITAEEKEDLALIIIECGAKYEKDGAHLQAINAFTTAATLSPDHRGICYLYTSRSYLACNQNESALIAAQIAAGHALTIEVWSSAVDCMAQGLRNLDLVAQVVTQYSLQAHQLYVQLRDFWLGRKNLDLALDQAEKALAIFISPETIEMYRRIRLSKLNEIALKTPDLTKQIQTIRLDLYTEIFQPLYVERLRNLQDIRENAHRFARLLGVERHAYLQATLERYEQLLQWHGYKQIEENKPLSSEDLNEIRANVGLIFHDQDETANSLHHEIYDVPLTLLQQYNEIPSKMAFFLLGFDSGDICNAVKYRRLAALSQRCQGRLLTLNIEGIVHNTQETPLTLNQYLLDSCIAFQDHQLIKWAEAREEFYTTLSWKEIEVRAKGDPSFKEVFNPFTFTTHLLGEAGIFPLCFSDEKVEDPEALRAALDRAPAQWTDWACNPFDDS